MTRFLEITRITLFILILFNIGCSEEESVTILAPEADFIAEEFRYVDIDIPVFDLSDQVILNNRSVNGIRYEWDFGDGQKSIDFMGSHKYDSSGEYNVTLAVYNSNDDREEITKTIRVGERRIIGLFIESSEVEFPSDVILFTGESDNSENFFLFSLPRNFTNDRLPFGGTIDLGESLRNADWFLSLVQNYPPFDIFDQNDILIYGATFNPYLEKPTSFDGEVGSFIINESKNAQGQLTDGLVFRIDYLLM